MSEPTIGMIIPWSLSWAPPGWAFCNGQMQPTAEKNANQQSNPFYLLFNLIQYQYGGSGAHFALPDLRGRTILGYGIDMRNQLNYNLGTAGGADMVQLTVDQLPSHAHAVSPSSSGVTGSMPFKTSGNPATSPQPIGPPSAANSPETDSNGANYVINNYASNPLITSEVQLPAAVQLTPSEYTGVTMNTTGGDMPHENRQPFLVLNFIINFNGVYPSRQ